MNQNQPRKYLAAFSIIALGSLLLIGCGPNQGSTGGRVDPYKTHSADLRSTEVSTVGLLEFSDQVSQAIVQRISSIKEITDRPNKVVVELGAIKNETRTGTHDYNQIRRRIMSNLVNSDILRKYADVMETIETMDSQSRRLAQEQPPDLLDEGVRGDDDKVRYAADITYVLNGYFGEQVRGGGAKSTYFLQMTLTHLGSRRVVFSEGFDLAQVR